MTLSNNWLALILSLPTENTTVRMRIYRALKALGCGVLRDGVYLLPDNATARAAFQRQADEIVAAGGSAHLMSVDPLNSDSAAVRALFDRTPEYGEISKRLGQLRTDIDGNDIAALTRTLKQCQRDFNNTIAIDYFPGPAQAQTAEALSRLQTQLAAYASTGEPHAASGEIVRLDPRDYQGCTWATRAQLWVDRVASAWLIRHFIDRKARFLWLKDVQDCPRRALSFDFDGARFTHVGARVTFEVLLASFGLESDPALVRLGAMIHYLDVGGIPVNEAPGFLCMLEGVRARTLSDDDKFLHETTAMLDALYAAYRAALTPAPVTTLVKKTKPKTRKGRSHVKRNVRRGRV